MIYKDPFDIIAKNPIFFNAMFGNKDDNSWPDPQGIAPEQETWNTLEKWSNLKKTFDDCSEKFKELQFSYNALESEQKKNCILYLWFIDYFNIPINSTAFTYLDDKIYNCVIKYDKARKILTKCSLQYRELIEA